MSEVANMPKASVSDHSSVSVTAIAADIPKESLKSEVNDLSPGSQLGTSPNQEKSSNSHHHDSEYDTASDLEGGAHDDYDDEDGEEEEDEDSNEDVGNTDTDSIEYDVERQRGDGQEQIDYLKKVDEDRSNPQYIPKKGTFYEHDDRTADEPEGNLLQTVETTEVGENKSSSPTTISQASKTMKKWQPASGIDRWSHDRFDASEQAPKSRAELVSAYGYDIRNEDGPPRARRRRRYARGPSKYSRNWEDETAYIKASNTQRKPPKPEDFPALEERQKARKSRSHRDEKENRFDRQQMDRSRPVAQQPSSRDGKDQRKTGGNVKNYKTNSKQSPMEFKNKNRANVNTIAVSSNLNRGGKTSDKDNSINRPVHQSVDVNEEHSNLQKITANNKTLNIQHTVKVINSSYNGYEQHQSNDQSLNMLNNSNTSSYNNRDVATDKFSSNHIRQPASTPNTSNLSARLHQAQNRNDPSHVGSVQMHTLANQHTTQVSNQNSMQNTIIDVQQQHQNTPQSVSQQEQSRTKRYSSLRQRSQHETASGVPSNQHMDQHTLQQLHMQQEVQQQQIATNVHPSQQIMLQDQHLLQANLMQLYHQENLQAQMQALQVSALPQVSASQQTGVGKQYSAIQPQYSAGASAPPGAAYYTPTTPDYNATTAASGPQQAQYSQQTTAFIQAPAPQAPLAFAASPQQSLSQNTMAPPITVSATAQVPSGSVNYVQTAPQNPSAAPAAGYPNFGNYQNFNTVGGTTYFVPSPQATTRSVVLQQRRPTNAIPILPPSEKTKRSQDSKEEDSKISTTSGGTSIVSPSANAPIGSAENIDHILDNMFVQRQPYQPQTRKSASPPNEDVNKSVPGGGSSVHGESMSGKVRTQNTSADVETSAKTLEEKCLTAVAITKTDSASNPADGPLLDENMGKKAVQQ